MDDKEEIDYLLKDLDLTHTSIVDTWKVYMTWYTFFFTSNLIVMSWVFTGKELRTDHLWLLCLFWIVLNISGAISSFMLAKYSTNMASRMNRILCHLSSSSFSADKSSPFPVQLSVFGAYANGAALIINIGVWIYIWRYIG